MTIQETLPGSVNQPPDSVQPVPNEQKPSFEPPFIGKLDVPSKGFDGLGRVIYGFVKVPVAFIRDNPSFAKGLDDDGKEALERLLGPNKDTKEAQVSLFMHRTAMLSDTLKAGFELVPVVIGYNPQRKSLYIQEAVTPADYRQMKEEEYNRGAQERLKTSTRNAFYVAARKAIEDLHLPHITSTLIDELVQGSLLSVSKPEDDFPSTLDRVRRNAEFREKVIVFEENRPVLEVQAREIATRIGGRVDSEKGSVKVWLELPKDIYDKADKAYQACIEIERTLANERNFFGKETGKFSGATIHRYRESSESDAYSNRGGSEWVQTDVVEEPYKPVESHLMWSQSVTDDPVDRVSDWESVQASIKVLDGWEVKEQAAQEYLEAYRKEKEQDSDRRQRLAADLKLLTQKEPLPQADVSYKEAKTMEWLGIPVTVYSEIYNPGGRQGPQTIHHCVVTFSDGNHMIDLVDFPDNWVRENFFPIHTQAREAWDRKQPERAVVKDETKEEAVERLTKAESLVEDSLPEIPGVTWDVSYLGIRGLADVGRDAPLAQRPEISGAMEDSIYYTHKLMMMIPGADPVKVGTIGIRPANRGPGFVAEVYGFPNKYSNPSNIIEDLCKEHPEWDPRLIRTIWEVIPSESEHKK